MILLSRLVMLVIVVVLLVFCMSNLEPVTVKFVGWESPQMPLFLILMFVFFFGFFLALFWQSLRSLTKQKEHRKEPVVAAAKSEKKKTGNGLKWGRKKADKPVKEKIAVEAETEKKAEHDGPPVEAPATEEEKN